MITYNKYSNSYDWSLTALEGQLVEQRYVSPYCTVLKRTGHHMWNNEDSLAYSEYLNTIKHNGMSKKKVVFATQPGFITLS